MKNNTEAPKFSPEQSKNQESENVGIEHQKRLFEQIDERANEKSHENSEQNARHEVEKAISAEHEPVATVERQPSPAERRGPASKSEQDTSFKTTMNEVQSQMSAPSRAFSKVIHAKTVEKASEFTGATVARPNAILSGAIFAFIITLAVYLVAKNIGYPLSGFESIGAFILGWLLGIAYDFIKAMITGRR